MSNRVSESEKIVLEVLWRASPVSSLEVVQQLQTQDWNEKTVKTFLNRLVKKGVVSFEQDGRRYLYSPTIKREAFLAQESSGFLEKIFKGDIKELLATFVSNKQLSENELEYLQGLLDDHGSETSAQSSATSSATPTRDQDK